MTGIGKGARSLSQTLNGSCRWNRVNPTKGAAPFLALRYKWISSPHFTNEDYGKTWKLHYVESIKDTAACDACDDSTPILLPFQFIPAV